MKSIFKHRPGDMIIYFGHQVQRGEPILLGLIISYLSDSAADTKFIDYGYSHVFWFSIRDQARKRVATTLERNEWIDQCCEIIKKT